MNDFAFNVGVMVKSAREFDPDEQGSIDRESSKWIPKVFSNYGDPAETGMSSPNKSAIMAALAAGLMGGASGGLLGAAHDAANRRGAGRSTLLGAGTGALLAGAPAALLAYMARDKGNKDISSIMRRLPKGATKRDYLSDTAVKGDMDRQNMLASALMVGAMR